MGGAENSNIIASAFFNTVHLLPKDVRFKHGGAKTASCPEHQLGTRAAILSYWKSFVNSFLCNNSFVCYANVANSFIGYIDLKYIWANYVLLKPWVFTPTLKKHQVVRDLKKFENHCCRPTALSGMLLNNFSTSTCFAILSWLSSSALAQHSVIHTKISHPVPTPHQVQPAPAAHQVRLAPPALTAVRVNPPRAGL